MPVIRPRSWSGPRPPFIRVSRAVLNRTGSLTSGGRLVAMAIAMHMNIQPKQGLHVSFPSVALLAKETGLCERTVRAKIRELRSASPPLFYCKLGGPTHGRQHRSFRFQLLPEADAATAETPVARHVKEATGNCTVDEETGSSCRVDPAPFA